MNHRTPDPAEEEGLSTSPVDACVESSRFFRSEVGGFGILKQVWSSLVPTRLLDFCDPFRETTSTTQEGHKGPLGWEDVSFETSPLTPPGYHEGAATPSLFQQEITTAVYKTPNGKNHRLFLTTSDSCTVSPLTTTPRELRSTGTSDSTLNSSRRRLFDSASSMTKDWKRRLAWIVLVVLFCLGFCEQTAPNTQRQMVEQSAVTMLSESTKWMRQYFHGMAVAEFTGLFQNDSDNGIPFVPRRWMGKHADTQQVLQEGLFPILSTPMETVPTVRTTLLLLQTPRLQPSKRARLEAPVTKIRSDNSPAQRCSFPRQIGTFLRYQLLGRIHWMIPLAAGSLFPSMQWMLVMAVVSRMALIGTDVPHIAPGIPEKTRKELP